MLKYIFFKLQIEKYLLVIDSVFDKLLPAIWCTNDRFRKQTPNFAIFIIFFLYYAIFVNTLCLIVMFATLTNFNILLSIEILIKPYLIYKIKLIK